MSSKMPVRTQVLFLRAELSPPLCRWRRKKYGYHGRLRQVPLTSTLSNSAHLSVHSVVLSELRESNPFHVRKALMKKKNLYRLFRYFFSFHAPAFLHHKSIHPILLIQRSLPIKLHTIFSLLPPAGHRPLYHQGSSN